MHTILLLLHVKQWQSVLLNSNNAADYKNVHFWIQNCFNYQLGRYFTLLHYTIIVSFFFMRVKQTKKRALGTCWEAVHELLHLHQLQSSHGDHLVDDRGALGDDVICCVLSAPQSQAGLLDRPHLHISALKPPTPVRSLISLTQACRGRSDPGQHLDGETLDRLSKNREEEEEEENTITFRLKYIVRDSIITRSCWIVD